MIRIYAVVALLLLFGGFILWTRGDAVNDAVNETKVETLESRVETIEEARERRHALETTERCARLRDGIISLSVETPETRAAAEAAFHRCRQKSASGPTGNSGVPVRE